jgi:hypothetical protein
VFQFLKISELNEAHRVASMAWGKFYRNVKTELTRHPLDRTSPQEMLKYSREEYDRLVETSPFVPRKVVDMFNYKFKKNIDFIKPEICDKIRGTQVFNISERERNELRLIIEGGGDLSKINEVQNQFTSFDSQADLQSPNKTFAEIEADIEKSKRELREKHTDLIYEIEDYINTYLKMNGHKPSQEEIKQIAKTLQGGRYSPGNDSLNTDELVDEIFGENTRSSPVFLSHLLKFQPYNQSNKPNINNYINSKPINAVLKKRELEPDIDTSTIADTDV